MGRRILITGAARFWGSRLAMALHGRPEVDLLVGIDSHDPRLALDGMEFVKADIRHSLLGRLIRSLKIDTVVDTHLLVDTSLVGVRSAHETNVIGMVNLLAACAGPTTPVRRLVVKSSTAIYGCPVEGPSLIHEDATVRGGADSFVADVIEVEEMARDHAVTHPRLELSILRFGNVLGSQLNTPLSRYLSSDSVPTFAGFDPRLQFIGEGDAVTAMVLATTGPAHGTFNIAADGCVVLSQLLTLAGVRNLPVLPPVSQVAAPLLALAGMQLPLHLLELLRHGRVVDNTRVKVQLGLVPAADTNGVVRAWASQLRTGRPASLTGAGEGYEPAIEEFLRGRRPRLQERS